MNCTRCRECLAAWHTGQLPEPQRHELQAHLSQCERCAQAAAGLERMLALLDRQEQPSPLLPQRFQARLARETAARRPLLPALFQKLWPTRPLWAGSYSLALLCVGLLGGQLLPPGALGLQGMTGTPALPGAPGAGNSALICPVQYFPSPWRTPTPVITV